MPAAGSSVQIPIAAVPDRTGGYVSLLAVPVGESALRLASLRPAGDNEADADHPSIPIRDFVPAETLPLRLAIFHMTRCGSTLVVRMLDTVSSLQCYDEPSAALNLCGPAWLLVPEAMRRTALERIMAGLGQPLRPTASALVVKFALREWLGLPLLDAVCPGLPKVMIIREPLEVLVSNLSSLPPWAEAQFKPFAPLCSGVARSNLAAMDRSEFIARCLGVAMDAFADAIEKAPEEWTLIAFPELPEAVTTRVLPRLNIAPTAADRAALAAVAGRDAKRSDGTPFRPDSADKQARATPEMRALCDRFLAAPYARLAALHRAGRPHADSPPPRKPGAEG